MRVAVTGSTGFIGRALVSRLASSGHSVVALGRRPSDIEGVESRHLDLSEPVALDPDPGVEALIHLGAVIDVDDPPTPRQLAANVGASWALAAWARERDVRFLHASSGGVYGCDRHPFSEEDPLAPNDPYAVTKAMAETAVSAVNPDAVILRYFFPYGPRTPNPIESIVEAVVAGDPIRVRSDGGPRFNPIHLDDTVELTVAALTELGPGPTNIAGTEITSFAEIAEMAGAVAGVSARLVRVESSELIPYYRSDLVGDITRQQRHLPVPTTSLADGIAALTRDVVSR